MVYTNIPLSNLRWRKGSHLGFGDGIVKVTQWRGLSEHISNLV